MGDLRKSVIFCATMVCIALQAQAQSSKEPQVTGANVAEDQVDAVLHVNVNHPNASDTNPGTESLPLKSVSRGAALALANRSKGQGTKVLIAPGVYRDAVRLPQHGKDQSDAPIIFEATENAGAVVSGSDVFTEWHAVEGEENLYWHHCELCDPTPTQSNVLQEYE